MSIWHVVAGGLGVLVLALSIADLLGPFRLGADEAAGVPPGSGRVWPWVRGWPRRRRNPLSVGDWFPHRGFLFLPWLVDVFLLVGGLQVAFGAHERRRGLGALAALGGVWLAALIIGYVCRPSHPRGVDGLADTFPTRSPGYGKAEVDAFWRGSTRPLRQR
jgi:hypothetical protein